MKTRVGKIARLPKEIREQLNQRLENGESGTILVKWLNEQSEVQKILTDQFAGQAIRAQNLSDWRNGGYQDWLRHQELRHQTCVTTEQSKDIELDEGETNLAESISSIIVAELAIQVQRLNLVTDPDERWNRCRQLARELSRLRRDDQRRMRNQLRREQFESTLEPAEYESDPEPQSADQIEIQNPGLETPSPASNADIADSGCSELSNPENIAPVETQKISADSGEESPPLIQQSTTPSIPLSEPVPARDLSAVYRTAHPDRVPPPNYPV